MPQIRSTKDRSASSPLNAIYSPRQTNQGSVRERHAISITILESEVSYFPSRHEVHNRGDQGISRCFVVVLAIDTETLGAEVLGEGAAQIAEGIFGALGGGIAPGWGFLQVCAIDPGEGSGGQTEIETIGYGIRVAGLGLGAADLLLDLAEPGFDTPLQTPP
jgi:hypothetical protein